MPTVLVSRSNIPHLLPWPFYVKIKSTLEKELSIVLTLTPGISWYLKGAKDFYVKGSNFLP